MSSYWVRPATGRDAQAVRDLARRVRRELQIAVRPADRLVVDEPGRVAWVVEAGRGEIVGCCGARERANGSWDIDALYLAPEWRGFGLGRSLLEHALGAVHQAGALETHFTVPAECDAAIGLARALGFADANGGRADSPRRLTLVRSRAN
jgi:GNAT superfamily N-acetyltransferase